MRKTAFILVISLVCGVSAVSDIRFAQAQSPGSAYPARGYQAGRLNTQRAAPPRPRLSPYLDLLRNDSGVLPPYHAFVVPRRRIIQQQANQWQAINQLQHHQTRPAPTAEPLPTGRGGHYQNYLHYYKFAPPR